jgi:hypothetical protein
LLGPVFDNPLAGVSFRAPVGSKEIRRAGNPDELVTYINEEKGYLLKLTRLRFSQPLPLSRLASATQPVAGASAGVLELLTAQLAKDPGSEVLRSDVTNVGGSGVPDTALIAVRLTRGTKYLLTQQAIIQRFPTLYYVVELTSPGSRPGSGADNATEEEKAAVATFTAVVDSMKFADRTDIRTDQDERLFRTRTLFVNWTPARIQRALAPEQWLRIVQNGKDVGYTYLIEETAERGGHKGVLIGARTRLKPDGADSKAAQVDQESLLFSAFDRKYEEWSNATQTTSPEGRQVQTEIGTSNQTERMVLDPDLKPGDVKAKDEQQPPVRKEESYKLAVTYTGRLSTPPVQRDLPPWYLNQAMGHLLPRLLPLTEPKGYLFASYVSDRREVIMRYVDVQKEREVTLGDKKFRAIPVSDRIGLQGDPTIHFISRDGTYLGSSNEAAKLLILPTDPETLQKIWANQANLTRPEPRNER